MRFSTVLLATITSFGLTSAACAESATGHASAQVSPALTIVEHTQMSFGKFTAPTSGTASVGSNNAPITGATRISPGNAGVFLLTGTPNAPVNTTGSDGTVTLNASGGTPMAATLSYAPENLDGSGAGQVLVNGVLTVNQNQTPGTYTGTYNIVVNYN